MTPHSRIRRVGWIATLAVCTALYLLLHLKVNAVRSDVINAEREIVALEQRKLLLETEFETRSNQLQLAAWNRVDFGYVAPNAAQFLENERTLARFGTPRPAGAPAPIRVAGNSAEETPAFPKLVSPLTGKPIDEALIEPEARPARPGSLVAMTASGGNAVRIPLGAVVGSASR